MNKADINELKKFQLNFMSLEFLRLGCEARGVRGAKPKLILFSYLVILKP